MLGPLIKIEGRMDGPMYRDIMENEMLPFARERMPEGWLYQQDNDPKYTSQLMMGAVRRLPDGRKLRLPGWFSINGVRVIKWPANSPDLNPIEHLWMMVKQKLAGKRFDSKNELWEAVKEAWRNVTLDKLIALVNSMPNRINSVIRARGGYTKY